MGIGCRRDALEANVWYVKAADQGDERAKHRIATIRAAADGANPVMTGRNSGRMRRPDLKTQGEHNRSMVLESSADRTKRTINLNKNALPSSKLSLQLIQTLAFAYTPSMHSWDNPRLSLICNDIPPSHYHPSSWFQVLCFLHYSYS